MRKIMNSFLFAFNGLAYAFKAQLNFKIHCCFAIIVVFLGVFVKLNTSEWLWISLAIDLVSPERNDKAGAIKDLAAAAVVVASLLALAIGLFIFVPKFI